MSKLLFFDLETTGVKFWRNGIHQIGGIVDIDVLTGGFPCQPFSVAGQRKGAEDDRYLWPEMLRVIRETRPLWVIGENVAGITNMVQPGSETDVETKSDQDEENYKETILEQEYIINTICDDLEREGYSVQPIIVPACGVGAPHRRDRVWFITHSNGSRGLQFGERRDIRDKEQYDQDKEPERHEQPSRFGGSGEAYVISDSDNERLSTIGITDRVSSAERWKDFPTQPPVCRGNDGLPFNVDNLTIPYGKWIKESIKTYGNAIVPQIAMKIFEIINKIEGYE